MITLSKDGIVGAFMTRGTLGQYNLPVGRTQNICKLVNRLIFNLLAYFVVYSMFALGGIGAVVAPLMFFEIIPNLSAFPLEISPVFHVALFISLLLGVGSYMVAIVLAALAALVFGGGFIVEKIKSAVNAVYDNPPKPSIISEAWKGWKEKYCPTVIID